MTVKSMRGKPALEVYKAVSAIIAKDPTKSVKAVTEELDVGNAAFYRGRIQAKKLAPKPKAGVKKYTKLVVDTAPAKEEGKLMVIVGTAAQVREALGGLI